VGTDCKSPLSDFPSENPEEAIEANRCYQ